VVTIRSPPREAPQGTRFAGIVADDVGIKPFGYGTSIVLTIGLWLVIAPAAGAVAGPRAKQPAKRRAGSEPVR
jgi:hypothetical protein